MEQIDQEKLNFDSTGILILDISLAIIMFGVALGIQFGDFKALFKNPKAPLVGLFSQFIALPFLTFLLVRWLEPAPSMALGMFMVAACPGGNVSNFMTSLSKGNSALSVTMTAFATALSFFLTPFNFAFYASMYEPTETLLKEFSVSPLDVVPTIFLILVVPLLAGMFVAHKFPRFKEIISKPIKIFSIVFFLGFLVVAFLGNIDLFLKYIKYILILVLAHNLLALLTGYLLGAISGLAERERRALAIETGIQNSGLGLAIIFGIFDGLGGMAFVAAWWGIWHIVSGLSLSAVWSRREPKPAYDGFSPLYAFFRLIVNNFGFNTFYKKLEIVGEENIPNRGGLILCSNHHNAFLDAMLMASYSKRQSWFLVRADIFANPIVRWLFLQIRMRPIFRAEDGMESLKKNEAIMEAVNASLVKEGALLAFPEGTQDIRRRLRTFRKGVARIAFQVQEQLPEGAPPVHIMPVGFNYSDSVNFRADLAIRYGKPLDISTYMELYREHPAKAYRKVISDLHAAIQEEMVHVDNWEDYDTINGLADLEYENLLEEKGILETSHQVFSESQHFTTKKLNALRAGETSAFERFRELAPKVLAFREKAKLPFGTLTRKPWPVFKTLVAVLWGILGIPLGIYGFLNNFLPWLITGVAAKYVVKNVMWKSSIKLAAGNLVVFPLFYWLQTMIVKWTLGPEWHLIYLLSLPITGLIALWMKEWWETIGVQLKIRKSKGLPGYKDFAAQVSELRELLKESKVIEK